MARKPQYERPLTPDELAMREANARREQDAKRQRKRHWGYRMGTMGMFPDWGRKVLKVALFIAILLIADGIRRESTEFSARIYGYSGQVQIVRAEDPGWEPISNTSALLDGDSITTGQSSYATIVFADGSAVQLDQNTQLVIRMLDFARGGLRDHSYMVNYGAITARMSSFFGAYSVATACTPTAIASTRDGGFRLSYNPNSLETRLQVRYGNVDFKSGYSIARPIAGQEITSVNYEISRPRMAPGTVMSHIGGQLSSLSMHEREPGSLQDTEYRINAFCDPALQLLGFGSGGWDYYSIDFIRRSDCRDALRKLQSAFEAVGTHRIPAYLNPATLGELQLSKKETKEILSAFSGMMIQSYVKTGMNHYTVYARARDRNRTLFELTNERLIELKGQ